MIDCPGHYPGKTLTADHAYLRFHGRNYDIWYRREKEADHRLDRYDYLYDKDQLERWIPRIKEADLRTTKVRMFQQPRQSQGGKERISDDGHAPDRAQIQGSAFTGSIHSWGIWKIAESSQRRPAPTTAPCLKGPSQVDGLSAPSLDSKPSREAYRCHFAPSLYTASHSREPESVIRLSGLLLDLAQALCRISHLARTLGFG
ncbi:MAG: Uncharacterized protein XD72_1523 [Methanothrix harundinacea]|jgi:hypothetical protein|uniref:Uncharacterized protein n=1 Tax=Methanothrix harundinacea TaxID=301375 RepID=A0A117MBH1_9EURY|nr:MAG: Uncharacterized protein XD72_1523 [Methanothrix harundinacea]KUK94900.1 MAG: Uncharacterized protein XE07_2005 [Methanothrix harundinacea]